MRGVEHPVALNLLSTLLKHAPEGSFTLDEITDVMERALPGKLNGSTISGMLARLRASGYAESEMLQRPDRRGMLRPLSHWRGTPELASYQLAVARSRTVARREVAKPPRSQPVDDAAPQEPVTRRDPSTDDASSSTAASVAYADATLSWFCGACDGGGDLDIPMPPVITSRHFEMAYQDHDSEPCKGNGDQVTLMVQFYSRKAPSANTYRGMLTDVIAGMVELQRVQRALESIVDGMSQLECPGRTA